MTNTAIHRFFANSGLIDHMVLRPLSHIKSNWELSWDKNAARFVSEDDSYAALLNGLIDELSSKVVPERYHDNEDVLAEYTRDRLGWKIQKQNGRWVGADYQAILEQGGFDDLDEQNLTIAAAGRIQAALKFRQVAFDDMERSHRDMLGAVLSIILYHRSSKA